MIGDFLLAYTLGVLTPLTAICVLPLYPGFLVFLANQAKDQRLWAFGLLVTLGATTFMLALGVLFTVILEVSLSKVTNIISPIAFSILALISVALILDVDFSRIIPTAQAPTVSNPYLQAFVFGLFFGAIILPCNPGFLAALLVQSTTVTQSISRITQFVIFGVGIGTPLIILTVLPKQINKAMISWLTTHKTLINRLSGILMLLISAYYLLFVFRVFG